MAYCTVTDLAIHNPHRTYDATTNPTLAQVNTIIDQIAAESDNALQSQGITAPATSPANFVTHLKSMNSIGAAAMAEYAMFQSYGSTETEHADTLYDIYKKQLKDQWNR